MKNVVIILLFISPLFSLCQAKTDSASINDVVRNINKLSKANSQSYSRYRIVNHKKAKEQWIHFDNKQLSRITID